MQVLLVAIFAVFSIIRKKKFPQKFPSQKFTPLAKLYKQTTQVESRCRHLSNVSFVQEQNDEMRKKQFKNRYHFKKSIYNPTREHDVIVIKWHWSLDYCVLPLYSTCFFTCQLYAVQLKKCKNCVISIKRATSRKSQKISTQQEENSLLQSQKLVHRFAKINFHKNLVPHDSWPGLGNRLMYREKLTFLFSSFFNTVNRLSQSEFFSFQKI